MYLGKKGQLAPLNGIDVDGTDGLAIPSYGYIIHYSFNGGTLA